MSTNNDNTQVLEPAEQEEIVASETVVEEVTEATEEAAAPVAKTRKEIKKERKAIKKHKKEVRKEAKRHSAKATKAQKFFLGVLSLIVVATMIFCCYGAIIATSNLSKIAADTQSNTQQNSADSSSNNQTSNNATNNNASNNTSNNNADNSADSNASAEDSTSTDASSDTSSDANASGDLSTKEAAVEYYKTAHAKVLAEAKSVTRTLDNSTNYKEYLEVGGNSTLAGIAKTLMSTFLKANEEPVVHEGSAAIAENFPPTNNSCAGLTADMIGEYSVKEEGDNYIISLSLNSSEENPDLGDNAAHLVSIVQSAQVEEAAAGFVGFTGLRNEYIAPTVTATINKTTGQMTELHALTPSYMKFDKATVMSVINVNNVGIGLQYEQKWTIQW